MGLFSFLFGGSDKKQRRLQLEMETRARQQAEKAEFERKDLQDKILTTQTEAGQRAAEEAELAAQRQKESEDAAYRASLTPADSEDARQAAERKMRRLVGRGYAATVAQRTGDLGAAPVATRMLLGA